MTGEVSAADLGKAHHCARPTPGCRRSPGSSAATRVQDLESDLPKIPLEADLGRRTFGVPVNIGQALLDHTKERQIDQLIEARQIGQHHQFHLDAAPAGETIGQPVQRRSQSTLLQHGRMQQVGVRPQIASHAIGQRQTVGQQARALFVRQLSSTCWLRIERLTESAASDWAVES